METLRYVLLANGLLAVMSFAYYVLLRRETFFGANRLALWVGMGGALVLPLLQLPDWRPQPVRTVMQRTAQVIVPRVLPTEPALQPDVTVTYPGGQTYPFLSAQRPAVSFWSWQNGLIFLYVTGVCLLLLRFGIQLGSLYRLIWRSPQEAYTDFTLVRNEQTTSPFSFFSWVVVNPASHKSDELDQILRHERVHVRERHSLDMIGAEMVCIIFWFNPAAYLFRSLLHQTLEFSADRAVLAEGIDARAYQYNLVKVSLSAGHSDLTNHFSKAQLKSRIAMINRHESTKVTWLKYPVFFIAALTVASAFARSEPAKALRRYVPKPVAETIAAVADVVEPVSDSLVVDDQTAAIISTEQTAQTLPVDTTKLVAVSTALSIDTASNTFGPDTVQASPSRYIAYQGDYLYWIVTPKTTFDDFAVMKQEFAKHGCVMQLNEVKYDPLYVYIDRVVISVIRPTKGSTQVDDLADDFKPISTVAGFVGLNSKNGSSGTGGLKAYGNEFPSTLRSRAKEDEATIAQFVKVHYVDYLIEAGSRDFNEFGNGSATFGKEFFKNKSTRSSGILVNPDGTLLVREDLDSVRLFVNNKPVERNAIHSLTSKRLQTVIQKTKYDPVKKESSISALLLYVTE